MSFFKGSSGDVRCPISRVSELWWLSGIKPCIQRSSLAFSPMESNEANASAALSTTRIFSDEEQHQSVDIRNNRSRRHRKGGKTQTTASYRSTISAKMSSWKNFGRRFVNFTVTNWQLCIAWHNYEFGRRLSICIRLPNILIKSSIWKRCRPNASGSSSKWYCILILFIVKRRRKGPCVWARLWAAILADQNSAPSALAH